MDGGDDVRARAVCVAWWLDLTQRLSVPRATPAQAQSRSAIPLARNPRNLHQSWESLRVPAVRLLWALGSQAAHSLA